jgi:hypothetical protein
MQVEHPSPLQTGTVQGRLKNRFLLRGGFYLCVVCLACFGFMLVSYPSLSIRWKSLFYYYYSFTLESG